MTRRFWTAREVRLVRRLYPHQSTAKIAAQLGRTVLSIYGLANTLGLRKTEQYLATPDACRLRRGDNPGIPFRYPKGHVPANKGTRRPGWGPGRMKETQFKKGQLPLNKREIGELRLNADGYIDMKVCEAKGAVAWRALHVVLWEDVHGPVPPGYALCFRDRDKLNVEIANLEGEVTAETFRAAAEKLNALPPCYGEQRALSWIPAMFLRLCNEGLLQKRLRADGSVVTRYSKEQGNDQVLYEIVP